MSKPCKLLLAALCSLLIGCEKMSIRQFHSQNKTVSGFSLGANEYPVIIIDGQSNALGDVIASAGAYAGAQSGTFAWTNSPDTDPDVYQFKTYEAGVTSKPRSYPLGSGWSVETVPAKDLRTYFGKDLYIIKKGTGGQPIAQWASPGGPEWTTLVARVTDAKAAIEALGRTPVFIAYLWVQGEAEVVAGNDLTTYKTALSNLINNVRGINASMSNIMFVSYKLSVTYQTNVNPPGPSFTPTRAAFNTAMQEVIDTKSRAYTIDVDSLSGISTVDGTHYGASALLSMGTAGYNTIISNL